MAVTNDPTLVFIHGSGDSSLVWKRVMECLPGGSSIAVDLPGHGQQRDRPGPPAMSVGDYAATLAAELTQRGLHSAYLAGHSLGGAIALSMALANGSLARGLALIGTGARLRVAPELLEAARTDPASASRRLDELAVAPGHLELARGYREQAIAAAPGVLYRDLAACDAFDVMAELPNIALPAIAVTGEEDRLTPPRYAQYLAEHMPNAMLSLVADAGHYLPIEQPELLAATLAGWLAEIAPDWAASGRSEQL